MKFINAILLLLPLMVVLSAKAQQSDNGDGTFTNPIIWSDFPDNDVIRVGDTYYMVCTSMYFFPGVPIMKSKDLVNWEYATNAIDRFKQSPAYDLEGGNRYGHGQWASSIRYHNGKFYVLFVTLDEGGFLCTADKAEGPWQLHKLPKAYYDAGLFFDDDGRNYIVHGYSKLSLTEVDANLAPLTKDSVIFDKVQRKGLEGSHVYKLNGYYYIYATYGGGDGYQVALRAKNIYGPYEEKVVLRDDMNQAGRGVHQGALVQTQTGEWWTVIFQDRGGVGRVPTLQPVTWVDGWPIVGRDGRAVVTYKKPNVGKVWPAKPLPTSDEFNGATLGKQWSWNHNPDDEKWSLNKRKGYLRLITAKVVNSLPQARNTLTQRPFGPYNVATVELDPSHMQDGDIAGIGVLQIPHAFIAVKASGAKKYLAMVNNGKVIDSVATDASAKIYLRAALNFTYDEAVFYYSSDNVKFIPLGDTLHMKFDLKMFTGNRVALFNYATKTAGGYADFNWFRMDTRQGPPNVFKATAKIEAEFYDEIGQAQVRNSADKGGNDNDVALIENGAWFKFKRVDFKPGYKFLSARVASATGANIDVYIDGRTAGTLTIPATGGAKAYKTISAPVKISAGGHSVLFKINEQQRTAYINWFSFKTKP